MSAAFLDFKYSLFVFVGFLGFFFLFFVGFIEQFLIRLFRFCCFEVEMSKICLNTHPAAYHLSPSLVRESSSSRSPTPKQKKKKKKKDRGR